MEELMNHKLNFMYHLAKNVKKSLPTIDDRSKSSGSRDAEQIKTPLGDIEDEPDL